MAVLDTYTFQNGNSYPLYPLTPEPSSFDIKHVNTTLRSTARSGRVLTRQVGGERIEISLVYPPLHKSAYTDLLAFLRYVGGTDDEMAFRMPILRDDTPGYSDTSLRIGEYYNINHITNENQLVQYLGDNAGTPVVRPLVRAGTTPLLQTWNVYQPYLRCSLGSDVQVVEYGSDGFVRIEVDLVERW